MAKETAKTETTNTAMWERLMPTNPKYTKPFKGAGGFSGTAINGTYIIQRMTEEFGPCGTGWRFVLDKEEIVEGHTLKSGDKSKLHKILGHLEYATGKMDQMGSPTFYSTSPQFGQTMLVGENKYGTFTDEEAPKKSITDCISKCAVMLGIAADVHLGLFDDNKYVNQRKQEEAAEAAPTPSQSPPVTGANTPFAPPPVAQTAPEPGPDDMSIARAVFTLIKNTVQQAKDMSDIDGILKVNGASLKVLERASPPNYENLKAIVTAERKRLTPPDDMNDPLPDFTP